MLPALGMQAASRDGPRLCYVTVLLQVCQGPRGPGLRVVCFPEQQDVTAAGRRTSLQPGRLVIQPLVARHYQCQETLC